MTDFHIHTNFSHDSKAGMEEYVIKAIKEGMRAICFTEHVDCNKKGARCYIYSPERFFEEFMKVKRKYDSEIEICAGMEFSEPHLYVEELAEYYKYPYDFILGSIHWVGDLYPGKEVGTRYSAKEFFTMYWEEVLRTARQGGFDALAHMDFPKRLYGEIYYKENIIREIFKYLLEKDIIIEINTSLIRKGGKETMPGDELLQIYKACGGKYVTMGSDAHEVHDLGADYCKMQGLLVKIGLQEVGFRERTMIFVDKIV